MELKVVTDQDKEFVMSIDKHVDDTDFRNRVYTKSGYVLWEEKEPVGVMVYCVLWDNLPFLNFLYVKEEYRGKGFAKNAILQWEQNMREQKYKMTLNGDVS